MLGGDLGDELEGLHHPLTFDGGGLGVREAFEPERFLQGLHGEDAGEVPLVELDDDGGVVHVEVVFLQVVEQVGEALAGGLDHRGLGVGYEDDGVGAFEHELAGLVVEDLAGDGVELDLEVERADFADVDRQQVEEERAVGLGGQRQHLSLLRGIELVENHHQVSRFPAEPRPVIDDLGRHLPRGVVEQDHGILVSIWKVEYRIESAAP